MSSPGLAQRLRERTDSGRRIDWTGWRSFLLAIVALAVALILALYSSAAAELGRVWLASITALTALGLAAWVGVTIVPVLAQRSSLRWFAYKLEYRVTREGLVYMLAVLAVAVPALNTGNNLLFMMLGCLLAGILISGVLSQMVLSGIELRLALPEHVFAGQRVSALAELVNHKDSLPSFSLRLVGIQEKSAGEKGARKNLGRKNENALQLKSRPDGVLTTPVYFPFIAKRQTAQQRVELLFPHRGVFREDALGLQTKFPFGFLEKTRRVDSPMEVIVYPAIEPSREFYEILPLVTGELESFLRGQGHDLYSIRDYQTSDSARHVDWKASAKTGYLQVREFAREDERRVLLVFDPTLPSAPLNARFERSVAMCASLAWHFHELHSILGFRTAGFDAPLSTANETIYDILRSLAIAEPTSPQPGHSFLEELTDLPQTFKIIVTCQPHGSIPPGLWSSSYILFVE